MDMLHVCIFEHQQVVKKPQLEGAAFAMFYPGLAQIAHIEIETETGCIN